MAKFQNAKRRPCRPRGPVAPLFFLLIILGPLLRVSGQPPRPLPGFDPQAMFEQFFGATPEVDRQAIDRIEIARDVELQIGEKASREYIAALRRDGIKVTKRGENVAYLHKLIAVIRPKMKNAARYPKIQVWVADATTPDARSFPGGILVFNEGILAFSENEAALVGVIGHELSHLDHGHQLYDAKRMRLMQRTFTGANGFTPDQFFRSGALLMRSFSKPFRPEDEAEADHDGATWAYELGYDPREMARLFVRMHERDRHAALGIPSFLRTHPYHLDRYQALSERYLQMQAIMPSNALYIGAENLRQRVPRSERKF